MNKKSFIIITVIFLLAVIYFYIISIVFPQYSIIDTSNSTKLNTTKLYFDTVSPIFTSLFSSLAILLGFYYYKNKNDIEDKKNQKERHVNFVKEIILNIQESSEYVYKIIHASIDSQHDLDLCRSKLLQNDDYLETLLDCSRAVYKWNSAEYRDIMRHRSFISKNNLITYITYDKLISDKLLRAKTAEQYKLLLNNSKHSCYLKIEKIYST